LAELAAVERLRPHSELEPPQARNASHDVLVKPTHPVFEATGAVAAGRRESLRLVPQLLLLHRHALRSLLATLRSLPKVTIAVPDTPASRELTAQMRVGVPGFRPRQWAVARLEIPSEPGAYRTGRSRKMIRAHCTRACAAGITAETLMGRPAVMDAFADVIVEAWGVDPASDTYAEWTGNVEPTPWTHSAVARTPEGRAIVFSKTIIAGRYARLHSFIQDDNDDRSSSARYLLMDHIVEQLRAMGVRHLFVDSVLALPAGLRFQQKKMGFTVCNVKVRLGR
jgi:hypothetical protein